MRRTRGVTLIEMLIVIAILAIMSASLVQIALPVKERAWAELETELQRGSARFFAQVVTDFHEASDVRFDESAGLLILAREGHDTSIVYVLREDRSLRRIELSQDEIEQAGQGSLDEKTLFRGAEIARHVDRIRATRQENSPLWSVELKTRIFRYERTIECGGTMLVLTGSGWKGGAP